VIVCMLFLIVDMGRFTMVRLILTDEQWSRMEPHCLGKPGDPGRNGIDNRMFMEAVLWKARTGSP